MEITEIRVKLMENRTDKLQAFCSVTIDNQFVIRDLKVIEGTTGPFVAMPSRKLTERCPKCGSKNHIRAKFCNDCGAKLPPARASREGNGKVKFHADVAHPINSQCREFIQNRVLAAFQEEVDEAKKGGYVPKDYDNYGDEPTKSASSARASGGQTSPPPQAAPKLAAVPEDTDFEVYHPGEIDEDPQTTQADPTPEAEPTRSGRRPRRNRDSQRFRGSRREADETQSSSPEPAPIAPATVAPTPPEAESFAPTVSEPPTPIETRPSPSVQTVTQPPRPQERSPEPEEQPKPVANDDFSSGLF